MGEISSPHQSNGSNTLIDSHRWSHLQKSFSGSILFKFNYFNLVTGDLSVLEQRGNENLIESLIDCAGSNYDINLIPALKKVADDSRYNEVLRHRVSGLIEVLENYRNIDEFRRIASSGVGDEEKIFKARILLAGTRLPQTTEILRLLREKSPEMKRLALYLIGKFKMTGFINEVCECLNIPGLENDAFSVLHSFGIEASGEMHSFYLASSGNLTSSTMLLMLLAESSSRENLDFIYSRLWSSSRKIKELALQILADKGYKAPETEKARLENYVYEIAGFLTWILSVRVYLNKYNRHDLLKEMEKEYSRWKIFLFRLLGISPFSRSGKETVKNSKASDESDLKLIKGIRNILFKDKLKSSREDDLNFVSDRNALRKLTRYFPYEPSVVSLIVDDIINSDYNRLSIWTKVCALHNMQEVKEGDPVQSVIALLFSPEQILREEAWRWIERSGESPERILAKRIQNIPDRDRDKLLSGIPSEKEMVYEKTRFLSSVFPMIPEEDLITLAEKILTLYPSDNKFSIDGNGCMLWSFMREKPHPEVTVKPTGYHIGKNINLKDDKLVFCYVLPLQAVEEYYVNNPGGSFPVAEYIDNHED
jgi:hypothetical protein